MECKKFIVTTEGINKCFSPQDIKNSLRVMGIVAEVEEKVD